LYLETQRRQRYLF